MEGERAASVPYQWVAQLQLGQNLNWNKNISPYLLCFFTNLLTSHWQMSHGSLDKLGIQLHQVHCIANLLNFLFSWYLNIPTNRLWIPCPGGQVHQSYKAGPCLKFSFLPSHDGDLLLFKHTNKAPSRFLLAYSTMIPNKDTCPQASFSFSTPTCLVSPLPQSFSHMAPLLGHISVINLLYFHVRCCGVVPCLHQTDHQKTLCRSPWWSSRVRTGCCHCSGSDSIPGPGTSACH